MSKSGKLTEGGDTTNGNGGELPQLETRQSLIRDGAS